jgi:Spy/CpxP family protein refolding chaperone
MRNVKQLTLLFVMVWLALAGCARPYGAAHQGRGMDYPGESEMKEVTAQIEKSVTDPEKAQQVKAIVSDIVSEVKQSVQQTRDYHRQLYELNAKYEATPEEFVKILDNLNNHRMRVASKILGLRFKMKELLTAGEWKALSDAMEKTRSRYRHDREGTSEGKPGA